MELDLVGGNSVHTGTKISLHVQYADKTFVGAMSPGQTLEQSAKMILETSAGAKMPGVECVLSKAWRVTGGLIDTVCLEFSTKEAGHERQ